MVRIPANRPVDNRRETASRVCRVTKEPGEVVGVPEDDAELLGEGVVRNSETLIHVLLIKAFDNLTPHSGQKGQPP